MVLHLQQKQNILLILHNPENDLYQVYTKMEATVSYLLMLQKNMSIQSKKLKEKDYALYLGNISKYFTINNMKKKTGLKRVVKIFFC